MLPKDIFSLINAYNEDGVYFEYKSRIWWFNGQKIKEWGLSYNCGLTECCQLFERKYLKEDRTCVDENTGTIYDYCHGFSSRHKNDYIQLPEKHYPAFGMYLVMVKTFVYYLSGSVDGIHEKYDSIKKEWSIIGKNLVRINEVFVLQNVIYGLFGENRLYSFDDKSNGWYYVELDVWHHKYDFFEKQESK